MKKTKNKICTFLFVAGVIMLIISASLCVNNYFESAGAGKTSKNITKKFITTEETASENGITVKNVDGHNYAGIIVIPAINIHLPVMSDIKNGDLKISPCRYSGDIGSRNLVIAGHNYRTHFGKLTNLKLNDEVYFFDAENQKTEYYVSGIEILPASAVKRMTDGESPLTLFTCTLSGADRYTVRCSAK